MVNNLVWATGGCPKYRVHQIKGRHPSKTQDLRQDLAQPLLSFPRTRESRKDGFRDRHGMTPSVGVQSRRAGQPGLYNRYFHFVGAWFPRPALFNTKFGQKKRA
jgi:hypothetical protein